MEVKVGGEDLMQLNLCSQDIKDSASNPFKYMM